jgi:hypothetical protein
MPGFRGLAVDTNENILAGAPLDRTASMNEPGSPLPIQSHPAATT